MPRAFRNGATVPAGSTMRSWSAARGAGRPALAGWPAGAVARPAVAPHQHPVDQPGGGARLRLALERGLPAEQRVVGGVDAGGEELLADEAGALLVPGPAPPPPAPGVRLVG